MLTFELEIAETITPIAEPTGFDGFGIKGKRNEWHGFHSGFSEIPLEFECTNGGTLIKTVYDADGQDGEILFRVICSGTVILDGRLDLNTYEDRGVYVSVNVEEVSYEGKLKARIKTPIDLSSALDLDGNAITPRTPISAGLHSQAISKSSLWELEEDSIQLQFGTLAGTGQTIGYLQGIQGNITDVDDLEITSTLPYATSMTEPAEFYEVTEEGMHTIDLRFFVELWVEKFSSGAFFEWEMVLEINGVETYTQDFTHDNSTDDFANTIDDSYTVDVYLEQGWMVKSFIRFIMDEDIAGSTQVWATAKAGSYLRLTAATVAPPTTTPGYLIGDALNGIVKGCVGSIGRIKTDYYSIGGCGYPRMVTGGYNLRRVPDKGVTITLEQALKSLKAIDCAGANIELDADRNNPPVLRVEHFTRFYNPVTALTLTDITSYKETVALDLIYNKIEIGYAKWETESTDGLAEFNTKREYATPIQKHENKYEVVSPWVAGGIPIERTRREQFRLEPRKDTRFDKDNFIICLVAVSGSATVAETNSAGTFLYFDNTTNADILGAMTINVASGVNAGTYTVIETFETPFGYPYMVRISPALVDPSSLPAVTYSGYLAENHGNSSQNAVYNGDLLAQSAYNYQITPLRNLFRHGEWINIGTHYKADTELYRFQTGEGNTNVETFDNDNLGCLPYFGVPFIENMDLQIGELVNGDHPAIPMYIECTAYVSFAEWLTLVAKCVRPDFADTDAYGAIGITSNGVTTYGYLMEYGFTHASNKLTLKLLKKN